MTTKNFTSTLAAVALGLAVASGPASAALTWYSPVTTFEDDNLDYVFDNNNNGILDAGDRLVSVLEFNNTQGILAGQGPTAISPAELTGIADVTILTVLGDGTLVFAPTNNGVGEEGILSGYADGTAVAMWYDPAADLNVINATCGTRANCFALAGLGETDGSTLWGTFGFFGDLDASWTSTPAAGGTNLATVQGGLASTKFGAFNFNLQFGINNTGYQFGLQSCAPFCGLGGDGLIQVVGSGDILGGQGLTAAEWTARSDTDAQVAPIPEPGSLALLGLALAGLGATRLRPRFGK